MAFERLRQEKEAEEIRRQLQRQEDLIRAEATREIQRQKEAVAQAEKERIALEKQKALAFRQESRIIDKLTELAQLIDGSMLDLNNTYLQSVPLNSPPPNTRITDRIVWDKHSYRIVGGTIPYYRTDSDITPDGNTPYIESYLMVETFPDGTISILRGHQEPPTTFLGFIIFEGTKGKTASLSNQDWHSKGSAVFEIPLYYAYKDPFARRYFVDSFGRETLNP